MASKCISLVRGLAMRATRLDGCGRVVASGCSSIASDGFVSVEVTANSEEGEAISVTNAAGKICAQDAATPTLTGFGITVTFCQVDPELYAMITGQSVVYDTNGDAVGFRVDTSVDPSKSGFALELWSRVPSQACDTEDVNAQGSFGYMLFPFVQGGILGDFTLENAEVTFSIQNAATKDGGSWGVGPYNVVPGVGGVAGPLLEPMSPTEPFHMQWTSIAPPEPGCQCDAFGVAATTATAGTPGIWGPVDSYPPATFADLTDGEDVPVASPTTAWTTGQHVVLGDGSHAFWNGTAWTAGNAP